jgi:hypothetical protein
VLIGRFFVASLLRMTGFKRVSNLGLTGNGEWPPSPTLSRVSTSSDLTLSLWGKGLCIFIEGYYTQGERLERSFWEVAAERPWRSRESASILLNTRRSPALTTACSWDSEMATG